MMISRPVKVVSIVVLMATLISACGFSLRGCAMR